MSDVQFDANEVVGGFTLTAIRRALSWVGLMDNRDDVKTVAKALECSPSQSERVLIALERRGFVTKAQEKNQWEKTRLGLELTVRWHPPRKLEPVVVRDEDERATNVMLESVPCSIVRGGEDNSEFLEEADLEVGVFVDYESPRVIEISVAQPDDYEHREDSASIETTVLLGVEDAKKFYKALEEAIEKAETELARRATAKPRRRRRAKRGSVGTDSRSAVTVAKKAAAPAPQPESDMAPTAERTRPTTNRRSSLDATLKELRRPR